MPAEKAASDKVAGQRCPVCGAATEFRHRPFCSSRCADVDLGRWLSGSYSIAGRAEDDGDNRAADESIGGSVNEKE